MQHSGVKLCGRFKRFRLPCVAQSAPATWCPLFTIFLQTTLSVTAQRTVILKNSTVAPVRDVRGRMWAALRVRDVCFLLTDLLCCVSIAPLGLKDWPGQRVYISGRLHCCLTRGWQVGKAQTLPSFDLSALFFSFSV